MIRPAHYSLYLLCSQERERNKKNSFPFFSISLQQIPSVSFPLLFPLHINAGGETGIILVWLRTEP